MVVVDEWHELLGNKRGVQVQLALARLRRWNPAACACGACRPRSATCRRPCTRCSGTIGGTLVQGQVPKQLVIDSLLPGRAERFPWGGHLGLTMLPQVVDEIARSSTTLVFTNTRSQAEIWYHAILEAKPEWAGVIALHHGSLDRAVREWVEAGLKSGELRAVVCTSSLDLGVDFLPVERVLQIGSPKGVARLLQRAGRSGHAPGRPSRITLVPTHSIEIVEGAAARAAIAAGHIEARSSPQQPLDVLVQHLVTVALGGGFVPDALYEEVRGTAAYADALARELGLVSVLCAPGRPFAVRLSRLPARRARRGGRLARARCAAGAAPPHEHRHHRERRQHVGAIPGRRPASAVWRKALPRACNPATVFCSAAVCLSWCASTT
jgi:ATP-dependent Lhr-like helicase